jgi:hypothetical protein
MENLKVMSKEHENFILYVRIEKTEQQFVNSKLMRKFFI